MTKHPEHICRFNDEPQSCECYDKGYEEGKRMEGESIQQLRKILAPQLALYAEFTAKEKTGEVDSSYVYDMACEWFNDLSRGEFCSILEALTTDNNKHL